MSREIPTNIETIEIQKGIVRSTDSAPAYTEFERAHFYSAQWPRDLRWYAHDHPNLKPEYFQLVGLVGILGAQYGFHSLDYTAIRHSRGDWDKPSADPKHQLALGIEIARVGEQAYPIKEAVASRFEEGSPGWWGAWNIFIKSRGGIVPIPRTLVEVEGLMKDAQHRFKDQRKIALPDPDLNSRFARLNFSGDKADTISDERFEQEVLPRVIETTQGWINPVPIFIETNSKPLFVGQEQAIDGMAQSV